MAVSFRLIHRVVNAMAVAIALAPASTSQVTSALGKSRMAAAAWLV